MFTGRNKGPVNGTTPDETRSGQSIVEAIGLCKNFGGVKVLKDLDLKVNRHEVTCILGPSGSGKSTFLRCINHLEKIDGGQLLVDDQFVGYRRKGDELRELNEGQVASERAKIGMVFQQFNLFPHFTVLENIIEGPCQVQRVKKAAAIELANDLLCKVGLGNMGKRFPSELSGGQQQRVAIARALAMKPKLILFDEPTSALDPELVGEVLRVMQALAAERMTMIVVTHEIGFARSVGTQAVFMEDGQVLERGTPDRVLRDPDHPRTAAFLKEVL